MAKKKKDEIVATIGLDGKIVKNNDKQNKNVVAEVDYEGNIRPYAPAPSVNNNRNNSSVSSSMNVQNDAFSKGTAFQNQQPSILEEDNSLDTSMTVKKNIENQISKNIVQGTFQRDIQDKTTNIEKNKSIIAPKPANSTKFDTSDIKYQDTGKTYGDYYYNDYAKLKDVPIYKDSKGKYYTFYNNKYEPLGTGITGSVMTSKEEEKKQLEEAKKNGYKEQKRTKTKEYKKAEKSFTKLKKEYNLTDEELNDFINNGNLSYKGLKFNIVTNSMMNAVHDADDYRKRIKEGKIKKYDDNAILSVEQLLDLETNDLTKKQRKEYTEDLIRQNKKNNSDKSNRINYGYDGTLSGTIKALGSTTNKVKDSLNTNIVEPANNIKDLYEYGKKQNDLSLEYYKKMEGENNNVKSKQREMDLYEKFNQDLITDKSWGAEAIRNANTQVESIKNQGISATAFGTVGSAIGTIINPGAGTIAGAKIGVSIGYTLGSIPYTYKLEAGNQYKTLVEMGVPENIAKKHSKRVGAINAAIESGENVVDLFTFNSGSGTKAITKQTVSDLVDEYGEKQVNSWLSKKIGDKAANMMVTSAKSYAQNIASESVEEMTQETTSIASERLASKESNINRNSSLKKDIARVLEAGSSAAISTAFTAPISSVSGSIATNTMNNIQSKIENKVVKSNVINNEIMKEINKSNSNISNEDALNIQRQVYQELDNNGIEIVNVQQNNKNEKYSNVNPPMVIKYQETDNQKINTFRQSAVREGMLSSKKTTEAMNVIEKIIQDKDYNIIFDKTITNLEGKPVDGKININKNGEVEIALNSNSDRAVEFLLTHEVTHAIETEELREVILDYAKKNSEFNLALQDLQKTYRTNNVNDEVIADISAQILGNQEFINSLSAQNTPQSRNIIKNIYESIKRVLNNFTSKGRYRNFVQDLETKWRDAYRVATNETTKNNLQKIEKYSKVYNNDGTVNRIRINDNVFEGSKDKSISKTIKDYLTKHIGEVYTIIESGQKVYLGKDLPNEYAHSEYTKKLPLNKKLAKGRAVTNLNEIIESATNRTWESNKKEKHKIDAKYGFYKYNTTFSFDYNGSEKIYDGTILIRNDANGKKYLYDILDVKPKKKLVSLPLVASNSNKSSAINSGSSNQSADNITQSNKNVKSDISTKYSMQSKENNTQELDNSSFSLKEKQLEIIKKENPMLDDYHTGIRTIDDIKTPEEAFKTKIDEDEDYSYPDFTQEDGEKALESGKITVYSSKEIKQGTFVSPSKSMVQDYAGDGKIFEQTISINDVAWINSDEGQYAKVDNSKHSQKSSAWQEHLEKNYKATGTRTYFDEMTNTTKKAIAPISNEVKKISNEIKELKKEISERKIPIAKEYQKNTIDEKIENDDNYLKVGSVRNLDPIQISNIKESDASTTPKLPNVRRNGPFANKESSFYKNSTKKSEFLTENSRDIISKEDDVRFYKGITNEDTLEEAYNKLQRGGKSETMKWFSKDSKDATAVDVAQGWILLKHYQDSGDYDSMVEVAKKMREIGTTSGQTVQAFNILARLTPEGMVKYAQSELTEAYNKMVENKTKNWIDKHQQDFDLTSDEVQFIIDTMKDVQNMEDGYDKRVKLAEIQKLMTDKLPTERGRKIKSWMRISMLFNPKTQVRNVMGNAIIAPINYFGDIFASAADKMIAKKTGIRTTGIANVKSILKGLKEGAYQATNDYKKGINTRDMEGNRFEIGEGKSFSDKNLIGKNLNRVDGLLNYVMDVGDRVFSQSSFENSLQNQMKLNNTTKITQDMIDIARSESLQRTWNDNNNYTKFVLGVRRGLNKIGIKGYGLGDVLIPFAKTPANLTKAIVDYSPIGLMQSIGNGINLKRSLTNGQYNSKIQHQFVQNLGKATAGTMLYVIGYALAKAKITTGESDDDKDVANFMKNTLGTNSYSIKIGNKSFTYDWAQPLAAPLSITANIVNKKYKSKDLKEFTETVIDSLDTGGSILLEQSFLQSINDVLKNNDGVVSGLVNEVLELPARAIPTFSKQIADMTDSTQRQTYVKGEPVETALNSAKAKIPFVSKTLTPSVDTMGRNIKKYGGKNNAFNVLFNPANVNNENISSAAKEIYKVYNATDDKTIFPRVAPYSIDKLPLSTKQRADYQKIGGELVEKSINELIKNDDYKDLSNKDKAVVISKIVGYNSAKAKSKVLKTKMSRYWNSVNRYLDKGGTVAEYYLYKVVDD